MRRSLGWASALLGLLAAVSCSRDWDAFEVGKGTGGSGTDGGGGGGLGGGQCFPGDKVCPDPKNPTELLCLKADDPAYGCSESTSCAPCFLPHASAKCVDGQCAIDTCGTGWADCNSADADGCETDLTGDKNHCGTCANDCVAQSGAGWICNAGVCEVNECCPTGDPSCATKRDCDGNKANSCEVDVAIDPNNCKSCGNACSLAHAASGCSQELCVVISCSSGWANCDGGDVNGCEIAVAQGDPNNCGACGKACNQTNGAATCIGGSCALLCNTGFGNCDNNPDNGCEIDVKTNPLHCSGCNKPCNPANVQNALCTNGACDYDSCKTGFSDCDGNRANGCEINTAQNINNCGTCGKVCTAPSGGTVVCSNGACTQGCGTGLTNCSGVCVSFNSDVNNCGACGTKCTPPANSTATCSSGACAFTCNNGWAKCGSSTQCFQIGSDATHCCSGAGCNTTCTICPGPTAGNGTPTCSAGTCGIQCTAPTSGKCGTGCYNFQTDAAHCGGCTTVCAAPANGTNTCTNSACTIACNAGFHLCGSLCKANTDPTACGATCTNCPGPSSGTGSATCNGTSCGITCSGGTPDLCGSSCVNKQTDESHCGACGSACSGAKQCIGGACG